MSEEYTCAHCGGTWEKAWTDEEAKAESKELGLWIEPEDRQTADDEMVIVCDDCFQAMQSWYANQ